MVDKADQRGDSFRSSVSQKTFSPTRKARFIVISHDNIRVNPEIRKLKTDERVYIIRGLLPRTHYLTHRTSRQNDGPLVSQILRNRSFTLKIIIERPRSRPAQNRQCLHSRACHFHLGRNQKYPIDCQMANSYETDIKLNC